MRPAVSSISEVELQRGKRVGVGEGGEILGKMAGDYEEALPNGRMRKGKVKNGEALEDGHERAETGGLEDCEGIGRSRLILYWQSRLTARFLRKQRRPHVSPYVESPLPSPPPGSLRARACLGTPCFHGTCQSGSLPSYSWQSNRRLAFWHSSPHFIGGRLWLGQVTFLRVVLCSFALCVHTRFGNDVVACMRGCLWRDGWWSLQIPYKAAFSVLLKLKSGGKNIIKPYEVKLGQRGV